MFIHAYWFNQSDQAMYLVVHRVVIAPYQQECLKLRFLAKLLDMRQAFGLYIDKEANE